MDDTLALIKAAKNGDKAAFGDLYQLYYDRIYRFIYYLTYDSELACDLTQNTFIKMWKSLPRFNIEQGTIQAYLFTIARNLVTDFRRRKREYTLDLAMDIPHNEDMVEKVSTGENSRILREALQTLPELERQLLILRYFEDLAMADIAKVVEKEESAVRVRIHRILKKLRKKMYKEFAH